MQDHKKALIAAAGLVVGLTLALLVVHKPLDTKGINSPSPDGSYVSAQEAFMSAYPLYSSGVTWSPQVRLSVPPHTSTNPTNFTINGYVILSDQSATTTDISSIFEPFRNYYDEKLLAEGWTIDPTFQADGPGSSIWGFKKGGDIMIFSYISTFYNKQPDAPVQCPCTIAFSILGGKAQ